MPIIIKRYYSRSC